jgi:HSP20 family protein
MDASRECNQRVPVYQQRGTVQRRSLHFHEHEIYSLFDELIHRPWGQAKWNPPVDVRESREAFTIEIDLPGVKAEDVRLFAQGKTLHVQGRRRLKACADERTAHRCERPDGRFTRTFEFDEVIEDREIQSQWQDGVLTLTVSKSKSR